VAQVIPLKIDCVVFLSLFFEAWQGNEVGEGSRRAIVIALAESRDYEPDVLLGQAFREKTSKG
jgi:hypothetical protein